MKSDEELKQTFKIFIDKNGIINLIPLLIEMDSEDNVRSIKLVEGALLKILNEDPKKSYNLFVDISSLGKVNYGFAAGTRKIGVRIVSNKQLKKIAFIASSIIMKTVISFIAATAGKKDIKGFTDKEEALKWLKEP